MKIAFYNSCFLCMRLHSCLRKELAAAGKHTIFTNIFYILSGIRILLRFDIYKSIKQPVHPYTCLLFSLTEAVFIHAPVLSRYQKSAQLPSNFHEQRHEMDSVLHRHHRLYNLVPYASALHNAHVQFPATPFVPLPDSTAW